MLKGQKLSEIEIGPVFRKIKVESEFRVTSEEVIKKIEMEYKEELEELETKTVEEILEEAGKEGKKLMKDVEKAMHKTRDVKPKKLEQKGIFGKITENIKFCDDSIAEPDVALANKISKALKNIKSKEKIETDTSGLEFDIDEIVKHKITKNGQPFLAEEVEHGFDIVILLDVSGSMGRFNKIQIASSACATLFSALKNVRGVNLRVIAFSCSRDGRMINLRVLKNEKEICSVLPDGFTPTWAAVTYAHNLLRKSSSAKKMIVIITDGYPELDTKPVEVVFAWTREAIMNARRSGIEVFSIINMSRVNTKTIKEVFGPEHTWEIIDSMEELPKKLYNLVINKIVKYCRG